MGKCIRFIYEPDTTAAQAAGSAFVLPPLLPSTSIPPVAPVRIKMTQLSSSTIANAPPLSSDDVSSPVSTTAHTAALIATFATLTTAPSTTRTTAPPSTLPSLPPPPETHSIGHPASVRAVDLANLPFFSPPSRVSEALDWLREQAQRYPAPWDLLVGLYFQHCQSPMNVLLMVKKPWRLCSLKLDALELDSNHPVVHRWVFSTGEKGFEAFFAAVERLPREIFENTIRWWAAHAPQRVEPVLNPSGWTNDRDIFPPAWQEMKKIFLMHNGVDKRKSLRNCRRYWPRFLRECLDDIFCGK